MAHVGGYTSPPKIGSRLARTVFERLQDGMLAHGLKNPFWTALLLDFRWLM
jgi:hypothetical protein